MYNYAYEEDNAPEVSEMARDIFRKYGNTASDVAREWAIIKESQGGIESAARWRLVADAVGHYRQEAARIRDHATAAIPAVRRELINKARQIEELAESLEKAPQGEEGGP
jgi:hypothetical protein